MALSMNESRTRRGLVAGALGGLAGVFGVAVGRPDRAAAGEGNDPDAVHKNVNNPTTASTSVTCSGATSVRAISNGGGTTKSGVFAQANGPNSRDVTGVGVTGVLGQSNAAAGNGVLGFVPGANATGVFANATSTTGAPRGVAGPQRRAKRHRGPRRESRHVGRCGRGVRADEQSRRRRHQGSPRGDVRCRVRRARRHQQPGGFRGRGGIATGGTGVLGEASGPSGFGGVFTGVNGAVALEVDGQVEFPINSGIATIRGGHQLGRGDPGVRPHFELPDPVHADD